MTINTIVSLDDEQGVFVDRVIFLAGEDHRRKFTERVKPQRS